MDVRLQPNWPPLHMRTLKNYSCWMPLRLLTFPLPIDHIISAQNKRHSKITRLPSYKIREGWAGTNNHQHETPWGNLANFLGNTCLEQDRATSKKYQNKTTTKVKKTSQSNMLWHVWNHRKDDRVVTAWKSKGVSNQVCRGRHRKKFQISFCQNVQYSDVLKSTGEGQGSESITQ